MQIIYGFSKSMQRHIIPGFNDSKKRLTFLIDLSIIRLSFMARNEKDYKNMLPVFAG
jgi:hypothetical protein